MNGTSLGMKPGDALPFDEAVIERSALVAECVIAPEMTSLLEIAQRRGCSIHTGVPMLEAQIGMMLAFMGAGEPCGRPRYGLWMRFQLCETAAKKVSSPRKKRAVRLGIRRLSHHRDVVLRQEVERLTVDTLRRNDAAASGRRTTATCTSDRVPPFSLPHRLGRGVLPAVIFATTAAGTICHR